MRVLVEPTGGPDENPLMLVETEQHHLIPIDAVDHDIKKENCNARFFKLDLLSHRDHNHGHNRLSLA
jgi:hypothetical protein